MHESETLKVLNVAEVFWKDSFDISLDRNVFRFLRLLFKLQTYVGDILIAVNPFKTLKIYDKNVSYFLVYILLAFGSLINNYGCSYRDILMFIYLMKDDIKFVIFFYLF